MNIEGHLEITIQRYPDRPYAVDIRSSRPLQAVKLFRGKSLAQLLDLLPLLYAVCGTAQTYTAYSAALIALGREAPPQITMAQQLLVNLETTREHLWRILLDWPKLISAETTQQTQNAKAAAVLSDLIPGCKKALFKNGQAFSLNSEIESHHKHYIDYIGRRIDEIDALLNAQVFSMSAQKWLETYQDKSFQDWLDSQQHAHSIAPQLLNQLIRQGWENSGNNSIQLMPELDHTHLAKRFRQDDIEQFIAQPSWNQQLLETGPYQRQSNHAMIKQLHPQYGNGLLIRLVARLVELAELPQQMRKQLKQISDLPMTNMPASEQTEGYALAQVEAARGRLIHCLHLKDKQVLDFRILAPTEWNFHPQGVAVQGLKNIQAENDVAFRQQANLWLNSIDPCVSYHLSV